MKVLHLSIITGVGIALVVLFGTIILIFPQQFLSLESKPRCNSIPNPSSDIMALNKTTWISVMKISENQTNLDCTSVNDLFLSSIPKIKQVLDGADECYNGNSNLCVVPAPMRIETAYHFAGVPVMDYLSYQATLRTDEAIRLIANIRLSSDGTESFGDLKYNDKYYQIVVSSSDKEITPQVYGEFGQKIPYTPVALKKGESLRYPITVTTLATYGKPAKVQFIASSSSADSNLELRIEPSIISVPERSQENVTLVVSATPDTRDGIYGISVAGKSQTGQNFGVCFYQCLSVSVNDSKWQITTYPGNGVIFQGGDPPPKWLKLETTINKDIFYRGDVAEITNFLVNDSPDPIKLSENTELVVMVYSESPKTGYQYYYAIQAFYDDKPLVIEPHSTMLLARPLHWDQTSYHDNPSGPLQRVMLGNYTVDVTFRGYNGDVWDNDIPIEIK
jgi:hypothetical protein